VCKWGKRKRIAEGKGTALVSKGPKAPLWGDIFLRIKKKKRGRTRTMGKKKKNKKLTKKTSNF